MSDKEIQKLREREIKKLHKEMQDFDTMTDTFAIMICRGCGNKTDRLYWRYPYTLCADCAKPAPTTVTRKIVDFIPNTKKLEITNQQGG